MRLQIDRRVDEDFEALDKSKAMLVTILEIDILWIGDGLVKRGVCVAENFQPCNDLVDYL